METGFKQIDFPLEKNKKSSYKDAATNSPGRISATIGRGDDAKNSLIYLTLKWAFIAGITTTFLIVINNWLFRANEKVPDFMGDIKITWEIIVPIITLALGYAFGKSQR